MIGRYGMDQLGQFIMYAVLALIFLNAFVRVRILSPFLGFLELAGIICLYARMFSKNVGKRYQENQVYLRLRFYVTEYFRKIKLQKAGSTASLSVRDADKKCVYPGGTGR